MPSKSDIKPVTTACWKCTLPVYLPSGAYQQQLKGLMPMFKYIQSKEDKFKSMIDSPGKLNIPEKKKRNFSLF